MQLVFGRDAILNIKHITDWEHIRQRRQERIIENNKRKIKNHREHKYATLATKSCLRQERNLNTTYSGKALTSSHKLMLTVQFAFRKES
jgi:hypothetical protein